MAAHARDTFYLHVFTVKTSIFLSKEQKEKKFPSEFSWLGCRSFEPGWLKDDHCGDESDRLQADGDGDGYISSLQALLALKNIVPAELLSEEEEVYVYKVSFLTPLQTTLQSKPEGGSSWRPTETFLTE